MELKRATLYRALFSKRQLYEMMVEFWNNHFSMYHFKDDVAVLKTIDDRAVSRPLAFGRFRDLLLASAHSPAMMVYLDNASNVADGPNENYARELMELHTIGSGAGYTQTDVHEVARCFTGWTVDYNGQGTDGEFLFDPDSHDPGPKPVLGVAIAGGDPGSARRPAGAGDPGAPPLLRHLHQHQALPPLRRRRAARLGGGQGGGDLHVDRRRHPRRAAHDPALRRVLRRRRAEAAAPLRVPGRRPARPGRRRRRPTGSTT